MMLPLEIEKTHFFGCVSGFANECPINPIPGFSKTRRTILLLLGEKAGMREGVP
jgi:hypothetical protein